MTETLPPQPTAAEQPWRRKWLFGFLIVGLGIRAAYVAQIDTPPFSDMADYETMALNLLDGRGLVMDTPHLTYKAYRPPLFPLFLASVYAVAGPDANVVRGFHILLSLATVCFLYLFVYWVFWDPGSEERRARARDVALVASALFCFEETSVFFCGQLLSESLFVFLLVCWSYLLVRSARAPSFYVISLAGLVGGLAILCRPVFGPVLLFGAYWLHRSNRRAREASEDETDSSSIFLSVWAPSLVLVLYSGLVVSFWTVRNQGELGRFVPVSTNGGVNFYLGHHSDFGYASFGNKEGVRRYLRESGVADEVEESAFFSYQGKRFIQENFSEDLKNNLRKVYYLYLAPSGWKTALRPTRWWNYLENPYRPWPWENNLRKLRFWMVRDAEGRESLPTYREWFFKEGRLPLVWWGWPTIYLTVFGIALSVLRKESVGFLLGVGVVYTLTLIVFFTNARFRFPLLPFLYPFAAYTLVWVGSKVFRTRDRAPAD